MNKLICVNVGLPRDIEWHGETVHTAIWKEAVVGRRMVRRLNIDGDGQGDLAGHGGEHRAVMVYQAESYRYWEAQLGRTNFTFGQFGENFTVEGMADDEVCIGDRYRIGTALFEVTQPRVTCYRVGIRMDEPDMAALLVSHHRPGFYFRVIEEGEVGAGDEITKVVDGPKQMTVASVDALLYLPGHPRGELKRSLRIPALSPGWKGSFQALLDREASGSPAPGNPGLTDADGSSPAWSGFRSVRIARIDRESASVVSLWFEQMDASAFPAALPGQFLVLKLRVAPDLPPLFRNYSISGAPGANAYRVSIKQEPSGVASSFLHSRVNIGDTLEISAPSGAFTLRAGDAPVVLVSAGIGATPVLAMLHALSSSATSREVWWLHGARNRNEHAFAKEANGLVQSLGHGHSHVVYSKPKSEDRLGLDYDSAGHIDISLLQRLGIPQDAEFYLCGPASFLSGLSTGLKGWNVDASRIHSETFGPGESMTPGIASSSARPAPHPQGKPGSGPRVSFTRSGLSVQWDPSYKSLLELAEACDVPVKWSCRTGVCHTCESTLIGGAISYQPAPLDPPEQGKILICCSQPTGDAEIDL